MAIVEKVVDMFSESVDKRDPQIVPVPFRQAATSPNLHLSASLSNALLQLLLPRHHDGVAEPALDSLCIMHNSHTLYRPMLDPLGLLFVPC